MNKEFRAWDKSNCFMVDDPFAWLNVKEEIIDCDNGQLVQNDPKVRYELMQWTGLYDRNGTKIFESDVVQYKDGRIAKVVWHDYLARFDSIGITDKGIARPITDRPEILAEVIGNLFETPNLLEET